MLKAAGGEGEDSRALLEDTPKSAWETFRRPRILLPTLGLGASLALSWPYDWRGFLFIVLYSWLPLGAWALVYRRSRLLLGVGIWLLTMLIIFHCLLRWTTDTTTDGWADGFLYAYLPATQGVLALAFGMDRILLWRRRKTVDAHSTTAGAGVGVLIILACLWLMGSLFFGLGMGYFLIETRNEPLDIRRSALLPLPPDLALVKDDGNSCGQGFDPFDCARTFTVDSKDGANVSITAERVADHLEKDKGWRLKRRGAGFSACRFSGGAVHRGQLCVLVAPLAHGRAVEVFFDST